MTEKNTLIDVFAFRGYVFSSTRNHPYALIHVSSSDRFLRFVAELSLREPLETVCTHTFEDCVWIGTVGVIRTLGSATVSWNLNNEVSQLTVVSISNGDEPLVKAVSSALKHIIQTHRKR